MVNNGMDIIGFDHKSWFTAILDQNQPIQGDFQDFDPPKKVQA